MDVQCVVTELRNRETVPIVGIQDRSYPLLTQVKWKAKHSCLPGLVRLACVFLETPGRCAEILGTLLPDYLYNGEQQRLGLLG
jgi:hypothetical protein